MKIEWVQGLNTLYERLDRASVRERIMIFVTAGVALYLLTLIAVIKPLGTMRSTLEQEIMEKNVRTLALAEDIKLLAADHERDPDGISRARLAELEALLKDSHGELYNLTSGLVSPKDMVRLVENILANGHQINVVRVENLPPMPLETQLTAPNEANTLDAGANKALPASTEPGPDSHQALYKHGMRIELTGRYADIVAFFRTLEALPWKVLWSEVHLETAKYPISKVSLTLYTLSLDKAWIAL